MKSLAKRIRARKMADGGIVSDNSKKTVGQIIGYPGPSAPSGPVKKAKGGMIEEDEDAHEEQKMRMDEEHQEKQEHNDAIDLESDDAEQAAEEHRYALGGMVEEEDRATSIAQAIRMRKMDAIQPDDPLEQLEPEYDELNEEAASNPEEINPSEGDEDFDLQNRIAAIRRKRMRG